MALADLLLRIDLPEDVREAIQHEITQREVKEAMQRESIALLAEAEKLSKTGAWQWDLIGDTWRMSHEWMAIHGCPDRDLSSEELLPICHPDDRARVQAAVEEVQTGSAPYEIEHRIIRQDTGEVRVIRAHGRLVRDENGHPLRVVGAAQDITELKRAQDELEDHRDHLEALVEERTRELRAEVIRRGRIEKVVRESNRSLMAILESVQTAIIVHDGEGTIVESNPAARRMLGSTAGELDAKEIQAPNWCFFREDGTEMPVEEYPVSRVLADVEAVEGLVMGIREPGESEMRWLLVNATPVLDENEHVSKVVASFLDITERKRAEVERETMIVQLRDSLQQIKTLKGIVPICMHCKKIRDDEGYWHDVEVYVRDHTEAEFSHGICVECARDLYGKAAEGVPGQSVSE